MSAMEGLELGRLLGAGGFADVYEAVEPQLGRRVAVKIFRTRVDGSDRKSFEREAQVTGRLSGVRNVVHVYRSGFTDDDHPFLVMERLEYSMAVLVGNEELTIDQVLHTGVVIGEALRVAHDEGILHRDLKPENILVDRYGEPAISDFGISSVMDADGSSSIYGFTAEHAAPELFEESSATPAADVYSLGATLFTLIEGRPPFAREPGEGPLSFMTRVMTTPCPPCRTVAATIPELDKLLRRALDKDPDNRPDLDSFVSSLQAIAATRTGHDEVSGTGGTRHRPLPEPAAHDMVDPRSDSGSDTVVGRGASRNPSIHASASEMDASDPADDEPPDDKRRRRSRKPIAVVAAVVVLAAGAALVLGSDGDDRDDAAAGTRDPIVDAKPTSSAAPTTTEQPSDTTADGDRYPSGVENSEPLNEPGVRDASALLRTRIDEFAANTAAPSVRAAKLALTQDSRELDFGDTPVRTDYGALNKLYTPSCYRVVLEDAVVLGAAASIWSDSSAFAFVNAAQFQTEEAARQYFWAASLFVGIDKDSCSGWPPNGVAVDPVDLMIEREDFALGSDADDMITAIDDGLRIEKFTAAIAYETVARVGKVVIVAASGDLRESTEAGPHIRTLEEALAAFSDP